MIMDWWLINEIMFEGEMNRFRLRFCIKVNWRGLFEIELWFDDLNIIVDDKLMTEWDNLLNLRFQLGLMSAYTIMIKKMRIIEHMIS